MDSRTTIFSPGSSYFFKVPCTDNQTPCAPSLKIRNYTGRTLLYRDHHGKCHGWQCFRHFLRTVTILFSPLYSVPTSHKRSLLAKIIPTKVHVNCRGTHGKPWSCRQICRAPIRMTSSHGIIIPLKTKCRPLYLKTQFVPRSKHFSSRL